MAKQAREVEKLFGLAQRTFGRRFGNLIFATHFRQRSQMRTTDTDGSGNVCWDIGLGRVTGNSDEVANWRRCRSPSGCGGYLCPSGLSLAQIKRWIGLKISERRVGVWFVRTLCWIIGCRVSAVPVASGPAPRVCLAAERPLK